MVHAETFFEVEAPRFRWICVVRLELLAEFSGSAQEDVRRAGALVLLFGWRGWVYGSSTRLGRGFRFQVLLLDMARLRFR